VDARAVQAKSAFRGVLAYLSRQLLNSPRTLRSARAAIGKSPNSSSINMMNSPNILAFFEFKAHGDKRTADQKFGVADVLVEQGSDLEGVIGNLNKWRILCPTIRDTLCNPASTNLRRFFESAIN
jgi:hypothetical protein